MMRKIVSILALGTSLSSLASIDRAKSLYENSKSSARYLEVAEALMESKLYFSAVPFVKEYLVSRNRVNGQKLDQVMDQLITQVGVKQFEVMPTSVLQKIDSSLVSYVLGKKFFRTGKYEDALREVQRAVSGNHPIKPFSLLLEGSAYSLMGNHKAAIPAYKECIDRSNSLMGKAQDKIKRDQIEINRDYCIIGIARAKFADGNYEEANLDYLDLPKSSFVWPEILFEEAWNSFYMNDYNRALGKLVTYKAPVLNFVFNPEIEILKAMSYLHLCLFADAKDVVEDFYRNYSEEAKGVQGYLAKYRKQYLHYTNIAANPYDQTYRGNKLLSAMMEDIRKDPTYKELRSIYEDGAKELAQIRRLGRGSFANMLLSNLKEALNLQRNLIGAYVRKRLLLYSEQLEKSFIGMSNIKLEILSRKKEALYNPDKANDRSRGDVRYLFRTEKQYFWTFNGEFWADELGDYVFGLKSECNS